VRYAAAPVYSSQAAKVPVKVPVAGTYIAVPPLGRVSIVSVREAFQDGVGESREMMSRFPQEKRVLGYF
jgi:hypothetical protein